MCPYMNVGCRKCPINKSCSIGRKVLEETEDDDE